MSSAPSTHQPPAPGGLVFHHSAVTEVGPFRVRESAARLPADILPFYLGSRLLALGLDSTGMQGLDSHHAVYPPYQGQFGAEPCVDDLYVFPAALKSNHATRTTNDILLRLPLGWLDYELELSGRTYHAAALRQTARDWEREFDLRRGLLGTRFSVRGVRVEIETFLPVDSVQPVFRFQIRGARGPVRLRVRLHLTLRDGEPLFPTLPPARPRRDGVTLELPVESVGDLRVLEPYRISYGMFGGTPVSLANGLAVETVVPANGAATIGFHFGSSLTNTLPIRDGRRARGQHLAALRRYWATHASVSTGDPRRDWLYHFALYLADCGMDMRFGAGCAGNYLPLHLADMTFWDAHFITDGLLHAGALRQAENMVGWLHRVMGRAGQKPFHWMVHYTGRADAADHAHICLTAHAMTAAKVAQYTRRPMVLRQCHEILQNVTAYALKHFFRHTPHGWILAAPATTDITFSEAFTSGATNNTFAHCWFLTVFWATIDLARRLGRATPRARVIRDILAHYHLEQTDAEYLDQSDGRTGGRWDSYVPVLLYPTEGQRWVDARKYHQSRMRHDFCNANPAVAASKMPWPMLWGAAGDMRAGLRDAAEARIACALQFAYGPGYLCEGALEGRNSVIAPYLTTCGAWLTAQTEQFFHVDFFTNRLGLFARLGREQERQCLRATRLCGRGGLRASGDYSPAALTAEITGGHGARFDVELAVPLQLRGEALDVRVNGRSQPYDEPVTYEEFVDSEDEWATLMQPTQSIWLRGVRLTGRTRLEIRAGRDPLRGFQPTREILVYDFVHLGRQLTALAPDVRWRVTPRCERFWATLPRARRAMYPDGITPLTTGQVARLEAWVRAGGELLVFYEAAVATLTGPFSVANKAIARLAGLDLQHARGNRWERAPSPTTIRRTPAAPRAWPATVSFPDHARFRGRVGADVDVLYTAGASQPYFTRRRVGRGRVFWIASGRTYYCRREFLAEPAWQRWFVGVTQSWQDGDL